MFLTIYFDGQFWVGLIECVDDSRLRVARHIFGAEPGDIAVLAFVQYQLLEVAARATVGVEIERRVTVIRHPKRAAREAAKIMRQPIVSTKAQAALKLQHEQNKDEHHKRTKAEHAAAKARRRELKREKARQRHRGR